MTATPPDPDPDRTPGLEEGSGVRQGDTPPDSAQTSGLSHDQPIPSKATSVGFLIATAVLTLLIAGLIVALGGNLFGLW
ncbi:DUF6480 family protein [Amycolatopsis suaedae]|uniref:Uncharacterized protein n=1 Tax=Amycolatopsis suaedae TaxID=2510978 RepID=A0A4Q7JAV4_9PSEU|nr:DUF6480 family protein [Amycolatopsis suaedae]RZQ64409.1 hypothetical protein EWH70_10640 [Amycolatopsis suaedae]